MSEPRVCHAYVMAGDAPMGVTFRCDLIESHSDRHVHLSSHWVIEWDDSVNHSTLDPERR